MSSTHTQAAPAQQERAARRFLKVIAEADPGVLARIVQPFQSLNIVPVSVRCGRIGGSYLEVSVEIAAADLSADVFDMIAAKLDQVPTVMAAVTSD